MLAAGLVIPAVCSAVMNPVMAKISKSKKEPEINGYKDSRSNQLTYTNFKTYPYLTSNLHNMRVGGL